MQHGELSTTAGDAGEDGVEHIEHTDHRNDRRERAAQKGEHAAEAIELVHKDFCTFIIEIWIDVFRVVGEEGFHIVCGSILGVEGVV